MNKWTIKLRNPFQHISVYAYFISVLIMSEIDNTLTTAFFYLAALLCVFAVLHLHGMLDNRTHIIMIASLICGISNIFIIGNLNFIRLFVLLLSIYVAKLFVSDCIMSRTYLRIYFIYALFVLFMIITRGLGHPIFTYVSNNYASVYLLCPLMIYYIKGEREGDNIKLFPAVLFWITCALTTSRMGLLAASFMLGCLILYRERKNKGKYGLLMIILVIILFAIPLGLYLLPSIISKYADLYIIDRFLNMGLTSSARTRMWTEYLALLKNIKYLLFGAPTDQVYWAARFYEGNLHNSYLIVHSYLGMVGFIGLVVFIGRSLFHSIKNKNWVFFIMLITFCVRSYSDHVFGCNRISPFIFFLIFFTFIPNDRALPGMIDTSKS